MTKDDSNIRDDSDAGSDEYVPSTDPIFYKTRQIARVFPLTYLTHISLIRPIIARLSLSIEREHLFVFYPYRDIRIPAGLFGFSSLYTTKRSERRKSARDGLSRRCNQAFISFYFPKRNKERGTIDDRSPPGSSKAEGCTLCFIAKAAQR